MTTNSCVRLAKANSQIKDASELDTGLSWSSGSKNPMGRNGTMDYARLIASFGIAFFHVGAPGAAIGYASLPFFLILLVVMSVPAAARTSFVPYAQGRARRLLIPWLIWSGVYGALKLTQLTMSGAPFGSEFAIYMLVTGPVLHLWFLPFAFVVCLVAYPAMRTTSWQLSAFFAAIGLIVLLLQQGLSLPIPFAQWVYGIPSVCLGLALVIGTERLLQRALVLCGFVMVAIGIGATAGLMQLSVAATAFIFCSALRLPETALSRLAGPVSLGIYLVHPLILSVLKLSTTIVPTSVGMALLVCGGALIVSLSMVWGKNILSQRQPRLTQTVLLALRVGLSRLYSYILKGK